jgi:hypothetical protein
MMIIVDGSDLEAPRPAEQVPRADFDLGTGTNRCPLADLV